ncbi:MAG: acetyl-CoA carboxylase biotin carboxyl carrier protein subunit [Bacteroidales bacterium]|nr:acetyl-CoA carboxylase biotin carboxyl carrier protein subunit [Bacteroidales bacterium]MBD5218385.1 acetyl-CoA carboxylase biotin carboxyl carrier protein subunit [Bacteroidales bacterium]
MKLKEYKYKINGTKFNVGVGELVDNHIHVEVNGTPYNVEIDEEGKPKVAAVKTSKQAAPAPRTESGEKVISKPASTGGASAVKSPLPGTIMSFNVNVGDTVNAGDTVCVLEAMKMENDVHCSSAGTVKQILVNVGDAILEGTDIMIIE